MKVAQSILIILDLRLHPHSRLLILCENYDHLLSPSAWHLQRQRLRPLLYLIYDLITYS